MVTTQGYYLTAVLALILSGISLLVGILNLVIGQRNRLADLAEKQESRAAEQAYKYSKEIQVTSPAQTAYTARAFQQQYLSEAEQLGFQKAKALVCRTC